MTATDWFTNGCLKWCLMYSRIPLDYFVLKGFLGFLRFFYEKPWNVDWFTPGKNNQAKVCSLFAKQMKEKYRKWAIKDKTHLWELATVITNLLSAIPYIGSDIVQWVWGGFSIANPTLNRFFSLHYLLPFVLAGLALVHLIALHVNGSNNPLGVSGDADKIPFHPYFTTKDLFGFCVFAIFFSCFIYFAPNLLGQRMAL